MTKKPNILYICSDQQHWSMNSVNGHPQVQTPNMQRLADRGCNFSSCYSPSPVCVPSRAALFSGLYPHEVGAFDNAAPMKSHYPTFATRAREQGYRCVANGKLDFHIEGDFGFEENECTHSHDPHPDITAYTRKPVYRRPQEMYEIDKEAYLCGPSKDYRRKDLSCEFLRSNAANDDTPWILWTGWDAPHDPYRSQQHFLDLYPVESITPPQFPDNWQATEHPAMKQTRIQRCCDEDIPTLRHQHDRAAYFAMITELDSLLGEVLDALEASGEIDNTYIIFSSDHGDMIGEHGMYYKNTPYDACAKVPLIIAGPGIPAGKHIQTPVSLLDVHATIIDITGAESIEHCKGQSLLPVMSGESTGPEFVYMELNTERLDTGIFSIVKDQWKYNYYADYENQLFNLAEDPDEWNNLINDADQQERIQQLHALLCTQVNPDDMSNLAFSDQNQRLSQYLDLPNKNADEIINGPHFCQFTRRMNEEDALAFIKSKAKG